MLENIEISRIKFAPGKSGIGIDYTRMNREGFNDQYKFSTIDQPHPDLVNRWNQLNYIHCKWCELLNDFGIERNQVVQIDVEETSSKGLQIVMKSEYTLQSSRQALEIKSPKKTQLGSKDTIDEPDMNVILDVIQEAKRFITGKRAQESLDFTVTFSQTEDTEEVEAA